MNKEKKICFACGIPGGELERGWHISNGAEIYAHVVSCQKQLITILAERDQTIEELKKILGRLSEYIDGNSDILKEALEWDEGSVLLIEAEAALARTEKEE